MIAIRVRATILALLFVIIPAVFILALLYAAGNEWLWLMAMLIDIPLLSILGIVLWLKRPRE